MSAIVRRNLLIVMNRERLNCFDISQKVTKTTGEQYSVYTIRAFLRGDQGHKPWNPLCEAIIDAFPECRSI